MYLSHSHQTFPKVFSTVLFPPFVHTVQFPNESSDLHPSTHISSMGKNGMIKLILQKAKMPEWIFQIIHQKPMEDYKWPHKESRDNLWNHKGDIIFDSAV